MYNLFKGGEALKISEVIERVDALYPNEYTEDEKLYWAYEVSAMIAESVKESYGKVKAEKEENGMFVIPPYIDFDDIEKVIADGCEIAKTDEMGENEFLLDTFGADEVYIVYKKRAEKYKKRIISGENVTFTQNNGEFCFPFSGDIECGDTLVIEINGEKTKYVVKKTEDGKVFADGSLEGEKLCNADVIKNADTLAGAPYEGMYINYIIAKILFNQGDIDGYNRNMEMFQYVFGNYSAAYKKSAPQRNLKYTNWW